MRFSATPGPRVIGPWQHYAVYKSTPTLPSFNPETTTPSPTPQRSLPLCHKLPFRSSGSIGDSGFQRVFLQIKPEHARLQFLFFFFTFSHVPFFAHPPGRGNSCPIINQTVGFPCGEK